MRCDECKHWNKEEGRKYANVGLCTKAEPFWDVSEWGQWEYGDKPDMAEHWRRGLKPEFSNLKMFVQDSSDCEAMLLTMPDFFCAHFEEIK